MVWKWREHGSANGDDSDDDDDDMQIEEEEQKSAVNARRLWGLNMAINLCEREICVDYVLWLLCALVGFCKREQCCIEDSYMY